MRIRSVVLAVAILLTSLTGVAAAERPFAVRYAANDKGDITIAANTLMTCPDAAATCAAARGGSGSGIELANNAYDMRFVDDDAVATTFNSSTAGLNVPAGAQVLFAGLYWGADTDPGRTVGGVAGQGAPNASLAGTVKFRVPGAPAYSPITAASGDLTFLNSGTSGPYQGFADVTAAVAAAGSGSYGVADVQAGRGGDRYAGWSLVVAYRDNAQPVRNLTVFDGLTQIAESTPVTITVGGPGSGFRTPATGAVNTRVGTVVYEGEPNLSGDFVQLNSTTLSDAQNPADNAFNSTISRDGSRVTSKLPDYVNQFGYDADVRQANGILPNNATSATLTLDTTADVYRPGVVTFATEIFSPDVTQTKSIANLTNPGGATRPGDQLRYTVAGSNSGADAAIQTVLRDPLPAGLTFVGGSIAIDSGANAGPKTDAAGDDEGEYESGNRRVVVRLGTGATATTGGRLAPGDTYSVSFLVTVDSDVAPNSTLTNTATTSFRSETLDSALSAVSTASTTTVGPDLTIAKTHSGSPSRGAGTTYSLAVSNIGNGPSSGTVTVVDDLPAGVTATSSSGGTGSGWSCSITGVRVTCTRTDALAAGSAYPTISIPVNVSSTAPSRIDNTGVVSGGGDGTSSNNSARDTITLPTLTDLAVTKSGTPGSILVGETATFTMVVTNNGPDTATGVTANDTLPSGLTYVSITSTRGTCDPTGACTIGNLTPGQTATITLVARATRAAAGTTQTNRVMVAGAETESTLSNNAASAPTTVRATADVAVTKSSSPATLTAGGPITYTIIARNNGPSSATNAQVIDDIPTQVTGASASTNRGSCTLVARRLTCALGTLTDGQSAPVTVTGTLAQSSAGQTVTNAATIDATEGDSDTTNNRASTSSVVASSSGLSLTKSGAPGTVAFGANVTYTLTATNGGPTDATGVAVVDTLPTGMNYVSSTPSGSCTRSAQTVTCALGSIAAGTSKSATVVATPALSITGTTVTNSATVSGDQSDANVADNTATANTAVSPAADLSLIKTAGGSRVAGGQITYTLAVGNAGPNPATGATITDPLPAGVTFVSAQPTQGSCSLVTGEVRCALGTIASGAGAQVVVTGTLAGSLGGQTVVNTATAAATPTEPTPANNSSSVSTPIASPPPSGGGAGGGGGGGGSSDPPATDAPAPDAPAPSEPAAPTALKTADLAVRKTITSSARTVGGPVNYAIEVSNRGPDAADGVTVTDTPEGSAVLGKVDPSQGSCTKRPVLVCHVGHLASGAKATISVTLTPQRAGKLVNTATVMGDELDPDPSNDRSSVSATITAPPVRMTLSKTTAARTVTPGQAFSYKIALHNVGPGTAQDVRICDRLPAQLVFISAPGATLRNGRACWRRASLAPGATMTVTLRVRLDSDAKDGIVRNVATAGGKNAVASNDVARIVVKGSRRSRKPARGGGVTG